jgi:transposase
LILREILEGFFSMRRYALRDDQWDSIKLFLPGSSDYVGVTAKDNRLFIEAVLYRYRAGIPWRDLPGRFGDFRIIHTRHSRWSKTGLWRKIFETLAADADNEYAMIDSTIVRAHQHSAGAQKKKDHMMIKQLAEAKEASQPRFTPQVMLWAIQQRSTLHQVKTMT